MADRTATKAGKGRPRRVQGEQEEDAETRRMARLTEEHKGNLSAMARSLKLSRQAMTKRIRAAGLEEFAATARLLGAVSGTRSPVVGKESAIGIEERDAIVDALAREGTAIRAAAALGITRSALYRKIDTYKIKRTAAA